MESCPLLEPVINTTLERIRQHLLSSPDFSDALSALYSLEIAADPTDGRTVAGFSQANLCQNRNLVKKVVEYADLAGEERVIDLFCGVGNLTLALAKGCREALGGEGGPVSAGFAEGNARANSIDNTRFFTAAASRWLKGLKKSKVLEKEGADVLVLDPPRGGGLDVARAARALRPRKIIYVSCSPPTLARDVSFLIRHGYRPLRACVIDMFPRTYHSESVTLLGCMD